MYIPSTGPAIGWACRCKVTAPPSSPADIELEERLGRWIPWVVAMVLVG